MRPINYRLTYRDCQSIRRRRRITRILGALFIAVVFTAMALFALLP